MFGLMIFAMLATSAPTDPGIASPGLDSRTPVRSTEMREQVAELPALPSIELPGRADDRR